VNPGFLSRRAFLAGAPLAVASCGAQTVWAPEALVQERRYVHDGPPSLTLFTVRNVGSGAGAHSALLINGSERVIFDPAGSFFHEKMPERNDVIYGASQRAWEVFINFHTRVTYFSTTQEIQVPLAVANDLIRRAEAAGPVPKAFCTRSLSTLLQETPGFGEIRVTFFPGALEEQLAKFPGVVTQTYVDDDSDDNSMVLLTPIA